MKNVMKFGRPRARWFAKKLDRRDGNSRLSASRVCVCIHKHLSLLILFPSFSVTSFSHFIYLIVYWKLYTVRIREYHFLDSDVALLASSPIWRPDDGSRAHAFLSRTLLHCTRSPCLSHSRATSTLPGKPVLYTGGPKRDFFARPRPREFECLQAVGGFVLIERRKK